MSKPTHRKRETGVKHPGSKLRQHGWTETRSYEAVAHDDKFTFNTIITVLDLVLGLNFFVWTSRIFGSITTVSLTALMEAFKDMAKLLRWRVLANRKFTARETDLILGGESLIKLLTLMRESMKKPLTCFVCACRLALNLLAQASCSTIGLTYTMDTGVDSKTITTSRGMVSVQQVYTIRWNGTVTDRGTDVLKCPISVSNVTNVGDPAHVVPDNTARMAAASIALSGRYTNPNKDPVKHWQQFQLYPYG
ncbi:MAG: hypothetical protein Q9199_005797 [Rusavskia elegans]